MSRSQLDQGCQELARLKKDVRIIVCRFVNIAYMLQAPDLVVLLTLMNIIYIIFILSIYSGNMLEQHI